MSLEIKMFNKNITQLIVTFAFFYSSIVCHFKAIELFNSEDKFLAIFLWFCALSSFLGGFRFQIAKIVYKIKKIKKNEKF